MLYQRTHLVSSRYHARHACRREPVRVLLAALAGLVLLTFGRTAQAWYFPEHAEIARIALQRYLPKELIDELQRVVDDARIQPGTGVPPANGTRTPFEGLPLCHGMMVPFHTIAIAPATEDGFDPQLSFVATPYSTCIPYVALPALAADHSVDVEELERLLVDKVSRFPLPDLTVAGMVVGASVSGWQEFRRAAPPKLLESLESTLPQNHSAVLYDVSMDRAKYVRDLDARLLLVDHDYTSRAAGTRSHFHDGATPISTLLKQLRDAGNTENALAQMLVHHMRSMLLAVASSEVRSRIGEEAALTPERKDDLLSQSRVLATTALLEHAFALHFMQDGFAAGHVGTPHSVPDPNEILQRHDYFNRNGLAQKRALSVRDCLEDRGDDRRFPGEPSHCWVGYGDGYLDAVTLDYAATATAMIQAEFALALMSKSKREGIGAATTDRLGRLLKPQPSWATAPYGIGWFENKLVEDAGLDTERLVAAIESLKPSSGTKSTPGGISSGAHAAYQPNAVAIAKTAQLEDPIYPCDKQVAESECRDSFSKFLLEAYVKRRDQTGDLKKSDETTDAKEPDQTSNNKRADQTDDFTKKPAYALWRPLLMVWPAAQADVGTMSSRDPGGYGFAYQVVWGAHTAWLAPLGATGQDDGAVLGAGASLGLAYRADKLLPGRDNRSLIELNAGYGAAMLIGGPPPEEEDTWAVGSSAVTTFTTVAFVEGRVPVVPLVGVALGYGTRTAGMVDPLGWPVGVGLYGFRAYWAVQSPSHLVNGNEHESDRPVFVWLGWDVEVAYWTLGRDAPGRTASNAVAMPTELRLRVGSSPIQEALRGQRPKSELFVSLELASGYSWFF